MILIYFNFQHDDNLTQSYEDRSIMQKISRKLNAGLVFILIEYQHLENQLYFDQQFSEIFQNYGPNLVVLIIGGKAFMRLKAHQVYQLKQYTKQICVYTSQAAAKSKIFQQNVKNRIHYAKIHYSQAKLKVTLKRYKNDYQKHINDFYEFIDQQYYLFNNIIEEN